MADTARSLATLQTYFANNTGGAITAQRLRDFLVSALGEYGEIYTSAASANFNYATTGTKFTGFDSAGLYAGNVSVSHADDKITVGTDGDYLVEFECSLYSSDVAQNVVVSVKKNGGTSLACNATVYVPSTAVPIRARASRIVTLAAGDYVEGYFGTAGSNTNMDITDAILRVRRVK